ncbi:hypothetical protein HG15A2_37010 [Adhaeretor mobilis]|uniref:Uncharacterized protein n=1 Tax=Adhaeretor mobilis TaxID=1930276 RepID=A0A517MZR9_9BACT|nr:hypothetical protein HG15A2_37010 [Adhaeretor mobilis]
MVLVCQRDADGNRLFLPSTDIGKHTGHRFYFPAWHYGFQILCKRYHKMFDDTELRSSYRALWFLFQRAKNIQPFYKRKFTHPKGFSKPGDSVEDLRP